MKVALYKAHGYEMVKECDGYADDPINGYLRISEPVEIEFVRLPPEATIPAELAQLDHMEKKLREELNGKLAAIQAKRKDLMALAPPSAVAV